MRNAIVAFGIFLSLLLMTTSDLSGQDFLKWSGKQSQEIGKKMVKKGSVKGEGWRVYSTNKSTRFDFRATWLTPSVIRATVRLHQLSGRLSNDQVLQMVEEAENSGQTVFLIELDAIEGAGIIPKDWQAFLQQEDAGKKGLQSAGGIKKPEFRHLKALSGTLAKDYKYERFWIVFDLVDNNGKKLFQEYAEKAELVIRIFGKERKCKFEIPNDIRERMERIANQNRISQEF
jgi:hypothetical protein